MPDVLNLGGILFEELARNPEKDWSLVKMTLPPKKGPSYLQRLHRHPSDEPVKIVSGQAIVVHGLDLDQLTTAKLNEGEELYLQPNEWHGIENIAEKDVLVAHVGHSPMGILWAEFGRTSAILQAMGELPPGFTKAWFDWLSVEFQK